MFHRRVTRRAMLKTLGAGLSLLAFRPFSMMAGILERKPVEDGSLLVKPVPSTGEMIPVIGMGTWITFNVGRDGALRAARTRVLEAFFENGGGMIDTSPMYGSAQEVLSFGLKQLGMPQGLFSADKVWTRDGSATRSQVEASRALWGVPQLDLVQVHNLLSFEEHLDNLQRLKAEGRIRYIGITTSHGRRHRDVEAIMKSHAIDFVQLTYNLTHREAEARLLPLALERGIAVIANRPFDGGLLVQRLKRERQPLPSWSREFDCDDWPQFLLKFIVSHPAVTCAIPATTQVSHMLENMRAARGRLPDVALRARMIDFIHDL